MTSKPAAPCPSAFRSGLWILFGTLLTYAEGQAPITFIGGPSEFLPIGIKQARSRQDPSFSQVFPFRPPLRRPFPQPAGLGQYAEQRGLPYPQPRPYPFQSPGQASYPAPQGPPQVYPGQVTKPQPYPQPNPYPGGPPAVYPQPTPPPVYQTPVPTRPVTTPTPRPVTSSGAEPPRTPAPTPAPPRTPRPTTRPEPVRTPAPRTPAPATPAPRTPAPRTPAPRTPAPRTPAPRTPAPRTPGPATPAPRTPAPRTPAPRTPAPRTPAPRTPAPRTPAPRTPAPRTPAPRTPAPRTPAPRTPAPRTPTPRTPSPRTPAPRTPAPRTPVPRTPAPRTPAPRTPAPRTPSPRTPAPRTPAPRTPAPRTPAPRTPAPRTTPVGTNRPFTLRPTTPVNVATPEVPLTTRPSIVSSTEPVPLPNRIWGKPHVICEETGILFTAMTFFPFFGEVFARQRQGNPNCAMRFNGQSKTIEFRFSYQECGNPIQGARPGESMYSVEVVVSYDESGGGPSYLQQFLARCEHQRIRYATEDVPRRVEEALEELQLVPEKIERKAQLPGCFMRVVPESIEDSHHYGKSNASEISATNIGQKLRIEFGLEPPSRAYGFLVKNCTVRDYISGREYLVLDHNGCSTDINILQHPHYDTYNDLAIVHWHAFKVPDDSRLSIRCAFQICSDIKDNDGTTSCQEIPTPPYCPNLVSGPTNSILFDFEREVEQNFYARRQRSEIQVGTDVCISGKKGTDPQCSSDPSFSKEEKEGLENRGNGEGFCLSRAVFSGLLAVSVLGFIFALGIFLSFRGRRRRRRRRGEKDADSSRYASSLSLHSHPRVISSS